MGSQIQDGFVIADSTTSTKIGAISYLDGTGTYKFIAPAKGGTMNLTITVNTTMSSGVNYTIETGLLLDLVVNNSVSFEGPDNRGPNHFQVKYFQEKQISFPS